VIARAGRIVAAYTRDRHVAWGVEWMRNELTLPTDELYGGWFDEADSDGREHED
jgi:hypothetical protein